LTLGYYALGFVKFVFVFFHMWLSQVAGWANPSLHRFFSIFFFKIDITSFLFLGFFQTI